jgi:hypothetical protein
MTKDRMRKLDKEAEPLVDEAARLLKAIEGKLPCIGGTLYARSPLRNLRAAVKRLKEIDYLLEGIQ